jgi:hypothetical protein
MRFRFVGGCSVHLSSGKSPFDELIERYLGPIYQQIFTHSAALEACLTIISACGGGGLSSRKVNEIGAHPAFQYGIVISQFDWDSFQRMVW